MSIHISSTDIYDVLSSYWGIIGPHVLTAIIIFIIIGSILNIIAESDLSDGEKYYFSNTGKDPITEPEENKKVLGQRYSNEKTPDGKMVEEEGSLIIEETDD